MVSTRECCERRTAGGRGWVSMGLLSGLASAWVLVEMGCSFRSLDHVQQENDVGTCDSAESNAGGVAGAKAEGDGGAEENIGGAGGSSGMGVAGENEAGSGAGTGSSCDLCALRDALVHRYSFNGSGAEAIDSVGSAHGTIVNASLADSGSLVLDGRAREQYVDLPEGIISVLTNATFEAWVEWGGGEDYQRIFDFGDQLHVAAEDAMVGNTYFFLSPCGASEADSVVQVGYQQQRPYRILVGDSSSLAEGELALVAITIDAETGNLRLFRNGEHRNTAMLSGSLADINDTNVWLGRSQFSHDPWFSGVLHEFRIYNAALGEAQLRASFEAGPDSSLTED